jgi:hypothetical protein
LNKRRSHEKVLAVLFLGGLLLSCGTGKSGAPAPETTAEAPSAIITRERESAALSTSSSKETHFSESVLAFTHANSQGRCHGLFVSKDHFLAPQHCFPSEKRGDDVSIAYEGKSISVRVIAVTPAPSEEVEGIVIVQLRDGQTSKHEDPRLFVLPEVVQPPFPLTLDPSDGNPVVCSPRRYNLGGLVAYECPTRPTMSGLVLRSKDSKPFAIHLGRKSGLGYGLVLGRIKNEIVAALQATSTRGQP